MALAPMADVTDRAFRQIIAKYGKPDVMWTEFVSADGLQSPGRERLLTDLRYTEAERPIVAQIFGANPEAMKKTAQLCAELGFDGIDINMGCPERKIVKQGSCSALIQTPWLAQEVIQATQEGAGDLPVSVKTRLGFNKPEIEAWVPHLLEMNPVALTMHGRTRKDMSKVPADWSAIRRVREIRDEQGSQALILGNGDVKDLKGAHQKVAETGVDGVMIGKGIFGNPWCFNPNVNFENVSLEERFRVMVEHTKLFEELLGDEKNFALMKKHYKAYVEGFAGAKDFRNELMEAQDAAEIDQKVKSFLRSEDKTPAMLR